MYFSVHSVSIQPYSIRTNGEIIMLAFKMGMNQKIRIGDDVELTFRWTSTRNRIEVFVSAPKEVKIRKMDIPDENLPARSPQQ